MKIDDEYRAAFPADVVKARERVERHRDAVEAAGHRMTTVERLYTRFEDVGAASVDKVDGAMSDRERLRLRAWVASLDDGPVGAMLKEHEGSAVWNESEELFVVEATINVGVGDD